VQQPNTYLRFCTSKRCNPHRRRTMSHFVLDHHLFACACPNFRFKHFRYITVRSRICKTGNTPNDVVSIRFYSKYALVGDTERRELGAGTLIQCPEDWCNLPALYSGLLAIHGQDAMVNPFSAGFLDTPLFFKLDINREGGATSSDVPLPDKALTDRLALHCADIGIDATQGVVHNGAYGFRRGGTQFLLERTGNIDLVMRLGGWSRTSDSFMHYVSNVSIRGSWTSTLRSHADDEVTQVVHTVVEAHRDFIVGQARATADRLWDGPNQFTTATAVADDSIKLLVSIVVDVFKQLRGGPL